MVETFLCLAYPTNYTAARRARVEFKRDEVFAKMNRILKMVVFSLLVTVLGAGFLSLHAQMGPMMSSQFQGPKANKGTVTFSHKDGKGMLTLSDDFIVPDTPDPHWQVVDSEGNIYLLDKLKTQAFVGTSFKKQITLPKYVKNVAKVQIWCAFAEVNLGEASFGKPVM